MARVVVIGAGVGGLTAAARLARAGVEVTVLEAHVYPGGCAGTFFHRGYRFDVGATLAAGFFPGGPMDIVARDIGLESWPVRPANPALTVHMPDGQAITRWSDERRWDERRSAFGPGGEPFWAWQERTADVLWDLALRLPPWPPQSLADTRQLSQQTLTWLVSDPSQRISWALLKDAFRPLADRLKDAPLNLRQFVDAQLLIAAQTTSPYANALYGASALDLPRRGVVHLEQGGIGAISDILVRAIRQNGGRVLLRQEVRRLQKHSGKGAQVETKRGDAFEAEIVVANLTPWDLAPLIEGEVPGRLRRLPARPDDGWGAFMVYVGLDDSLLPPDLPLHHQVLVGEPLGEGNSVFLSLNPAWDISRAPAGRRALTISTHTNLANWWDLFRRDRQAYEAQKQTYTERVLEAAEVAVPGLRDATELVLPGTPVTFKRFTRRGTGWVGGFPQTSLFRNWGPKLGPGLWIVGDSIFPGQSTAAVALGGLRVAKAVERRLVGTPAAVSTRPVRSWLRKRVRGAI
jgi:C-3',4' desaturase CrtD